MTRETRAPQVPPVQPALQGRKVSKVMWALKAPKVTLEILDPLVPRGHKVPLAPQGHKVLLARREQRDLLAPKVPQELLQHYRVLQDGLILDQRVLSRRFQRQGQSKRHLIAAIRSAAAFVNIKILLTPAPIALR